MAKRFEDFEPIFGEIPAEWEKPNPNSPLLPFLFHVHALDSSRLRIRVTDFHSYTWEAILSVQQGDDTGGSSSESVDCLVTSLKSAGVKLVLGGLIESAKFDGGHDATFAMLIADKSEGIPLTISLDRLMNSSANDAMASLSLELSQAFKGKHELVVLAEQECSYQLTTRFSAEKMDLESLASKRKELEKNGEESVKRQKKWADALGGATPHERSEMFVSMFNDFVDERKRADVGTEAFMNLHDRVLQLVPEPGSRFKEDFEIEGCLGRGGFSAVYLCRHKLDKHTYAVKRTRFLGGKVESLLCEVKSLSKLRHEHIVSYNQAWLEPDVIDIDKIKRVTLESKVKEKEKEEEEEEEEEVEDDEEGGGGGVGGVDSRDFRYLDLENNTAAEPYSLFIQMEKCKSTLLNEVIQSETAIDKKTRWGYFNQIVEAVAYMHDNDVVHKDLAASNILLDSANSVKVADFGIAKVGDTDLLESQKGQLYYQAPERSVKGCAINAKADIYSLGILLLELLAGFTTGMERYIVLTKFPATHDFPGCIEERERRFILDLVAKEPTSRPSAAEISRRVSEFLS